MSNEENKTSKTISMISHIATKGMGVVILVASVALGISKKRGKKS